MKANAKQWRAVLSRWAACEITPEASLVIEVLATSLAKADDAEAIARDPFFADGFRLYCRLIGIDPDFVLEEANRPRVDVFA